MKQDYNDFYPLDKITSVGINFMEVKDLLKFKY